MHKNRIVFRIVSTAIMLTLLTLSVSACLNPISIDENGYVVSIGADAGKEKKYEITFQLQRESTGENAENNGGAILLSTESNDIFGAINELSEGIAYNLNFSRTHVFIFGEALARAGMIPDFLSFAFDVLRIRQSALMIVTRAPVRDYLGGITANNAANIAKLQDDVVSDVQKTGAIPAINLAMFFEALDGGWFDAAIPIGFYDKDIITDKKQKDSSDKGENPIEDAERGHRVGGMQSLTAGAAIFDGETMVGILDPHNTQIMNIGRGDFKQGTIKCELPNYGELSLFFQLKSRKTDVDIDPANSQARLSFVLSVTVEFDPSGAFVQDWNKEGKEQLEEYLEAELNEVFEKCRLLGSDAFAIGKEAAKCFYSTERFEAFDWKAEFASLSASCEVELVLDDEYVSNLRQ